MSWGSPQPPEPRPDTAAAGTALLYFFGSLALFGAFLVAVPGRQAGGRAWLWVGLVLLVAGGIAFARVVRARIRYLRGGRAERMSS